jgi:hypothetical protein
VETLVNRVVEQDIPPYLLRELDLVVFPRRTDGDRYVGEVVELLDEQSFRDLDRDDRCGIVRKQGTTVYWNAVAWRDPDGTFGFAYDHPDLDGTAGEADTERSCEMCTFEGIAALTDRPVEAVEDEFHRKHRYVRYFVQEGVDDFDDLFDLLADLETDEAATVERLHRQRGEVDVGSAGAGDD